jgi:ribosomal protein L11 methyltransferase
MAPQPRIWHALDVRTGRFPFPMDDPPGQLAAFLDDFSPTAIEELPGHTSERIAWRVFFSSDEARSAAALALAETAGWIDTVSACVDVPDEHWAERSQASLRAIRIGRVVVTPPWDLDAAADAIDETEDLSAVASPERDTVLVVIEPSMGFGTGHHESTRLCLRALQRLDLAGARVVDLGTGSGVLAIAAARLGCAHAVAVDDDADAVEAARDNVTRNDVQDRVDVRCADLTSDTALRGDIVLGNLTGALLRRLAHAVVARLAPGGTLILSGFTSDERAAVAHAFAPLRIVRADTENGWVALTLAGD